MVDRKQKNKKDTIGFGGSFDFGTKHPKGMGNDDKNTDDTTGFGGTLSDLGAKDAVGVGEGK